jgi:MoaA/NifB/PqqE/SkfB family radical SAM enzyme
MNRYEMIIKPTSKCNFNCSFCSAAKLNIPIHDKVPDILKEEIIRNRPAEFIITGGEPLMNPLSYFWDLIKILDDNNIDAHISLTSNMMLWYNNQEKYDDLFRHPRIDAATSFQYGDGRKYGDVVYSEELFRNVYNTYYNKFNKKLMFIYVVDKNNEDLVIKAVELAKELDTKCKINNVHPVGAASEYYPRYKILEKLLQIIDLGLENYENNLVQRKSGRCPYVTSSDFCKNIHLRWVDNNNNLIKGCCEEATSSGTIEVERGILKKECLLCKMFSLCNGCSTNREFTKSILEEHCTWMKNNKELLEKNDLIV